MSYLIKVALTITVLGLGLAKSAHATGMTTGGASSSIIPYTTGMTTGPSDR